jgi:glycosyltransferase involved in cell wall biosynthesis
MEQSSKRQIDLVILNNCPAFYKINLYNELSKQIKIHVIFLAESDQVVIDSDWKINTHFSFEILSNLEYKKRNIKKNLYLLIFKLRKLNYQKLIFGGYDAPEFLILSRFTNKSKNILQYESSIHETKTNGWIGKFKYFVLNNFNIILASGVSQQEALIKLGFKGKIIITHGVGLINQPEFQFSLKKNVKKLKYLFVGRLIEKKNINLLIDVFNQNKKRLTVVGQGPLKSYLQSKAELNIDFIDFVNNDQIKDIYLSHDVFILPSFQEPWGLVVEEAIFYGIPVLISNLVGCGETLVKHYSTGIVFQPDFNNLNNAIAKIEENFMFYKNKCEKFPRYDFNKRQVESYLISIYQ